ncbi:RNA-directed DNA polymerase from mobile element jockey [Trichonephila clavipes]|uniref:RNA-directed DNA polymerase from mobile element jockey n=1 Tax=Trichonephila clavipes TaxID=2585209 RepID=A0A8X6W571_TRICX|nr:RNA-directed DNA polymerase from mobile element jockey [Trichonephila clavipes]
MVIRSSVNTRRPDQALIVYTDGSHSDTGRAGSGIFSNSPGNDVKISIRNPDHCSVFRSELIAISGALDHALNSYKDGLVRGNKCLQWIPSHVGVPGNEAADELAGRGCDLPNPSYTVLTHTEIPSFHRNKMNLTWRNPPAHHWFAAKSPGLSIQCRSSRAHQTALTRLKRSPAYCQVIYSQFGLAIHQNDHQARRRFVEWAQNEIAVVPDFNKRILFSDEAHFWLNGYVNKQNCRIWSEANPQVYVETPLHPEKLTVWCALWAGGILLQKR